MSNLVDRVSHVLGERCRGVFPAALAFDILRLQSEGLDANFGDYDSVIVRHHQRGAIALVGKISLFCVAQDGTANFSPLGGGDVSPAAMPDVDPTAAARWLLGAA